MHMYVHGTGPVLHIRKQIEKQLCCFTLYVEFWVFRMFLLNVLVRFISNLTMQQIINWFYKVSHRIKCYTVFCHQISGISNYVFNLQSGDIRTYSSFVYVPLFLSAYMSSRVPTFLFAIRSYYHERELFQQLFLNIYKANFHAVILTYHTTFLANTK